MNAFRTLALLCTAIVATPGRAADADTLYFGGPILTMNDAAPRAEALAVKNGLIVAVGSRAAITKAWRGKATVLADLRGQTMAPGFIDAHSHFFYVGIQARSANLLPPPDGPVASIADLQQVLRDDMAASPTVKATGVLIGLNFDDSQLAEQRGPTRQELDAVSTDIPVMAVHQSGHLGAYNSKALAILGITAASPNPDGGVIQREADGKTPNGILEENAHFKALFTLMPKLSPAQAMQVIAAAQQQYLANGFTTVQDGKTDAATMAALIEANRRDALVVDLVSYADLTGMAESPLLRGALMGRSYDKHFRIGGVKLTFDGSPQGKTAWFTQPYFKPPEGQPADYRGYPAFAKPGEAQRWVDMAYANNWQLLVHANGDAAIDQLLTTVAAAQATHPGADRRTVMIHGQYTRPDQVARLKALGIFPALFPMHSFYWGDWHRTSVAGPERAAFISPTGAMRAAGIPFSIHSDAPVTFPDSVRLLDTAVNRTTRTGHVLGPDQRLSPGDALKALTLWPAAQYFEETSKGSLVPGKRADLVILSADPTKVPRASLKTLKVLQTIKDGKTVWAAPAGR